MFIQIQNRKIHYKKIGSGPPMIFIHRWGMTGYSLHPLATHASKKHTVYLIDLPGFGKSENPPRHWGLEGFAYLVREFIALQKLKHVIIVGHGLGAAVAVTLASTAPGYVEKLILISCPMNRSFHISPAAQLYRKLPHNNPIVRLVYPLAKNAYYRLFHKDSEILSFPALEANFRKVILQDVKPRMRNCKTPTLIMWGENDLCTPVLCAYEIHKLISHSRLAIIPQASHDLPIENPLVVWRKIQSFLTP